MSKRIYGIFDDPDVLKDAVVKLKEKGIFVKDVQSPFPIHGIEPLIGVPRTRISIASFMYGIMGTSLAFLMTWYMMIHSWHIDIGGKPEFMFYMNLPAFIPVTFECTVFCAAHGMAITFLLRSKLLPGVTAPIFHPRTTDDKFVAHIDVKDLSKLNEITSSIKGAGASEVII